MMSVEKRVEVLVGVMVLLSVVLSQFVHPGFMWMTVAVGLNVIQQAFTGYCPAALVLQKSGVPTEQELGRRSCAI